MRLINADALKATTEGHGQKIAYVVSFLWDIDAAPTIDAIPVEWLDKMAEQHQSGVFNAYWFVLKTWQKEQEARA